MTVDLGKFMEEARLIYVAQMNTWKNKINEAVCMHKDLEDDMVIALVIWHGKKEEVQKEINKWRGATMVEEDINGT